jgi:SAM-dependent methyltransferase
MPMLQQLSRNLRTRTPQRIRATLAAILARHFPVGLLSIHRNETYEKQFLTFLQRCALADISTPRDFYKACTDDYLLWLHTRSRRGGTSFDQFVPGLPPEDMQRNWTGSTGEATLREALNVYQLIATMAEQHGRGISKDTAVLDFGCGWGRIIRFFLRDVRHDNLYGIDCYSEAIDAARLANRWCTFELTNPLPPSRFDDKFFDIIYLYSVFSHLSEEAHLEWLAEFHRILKPGGLVIATTWRREFILECAELRKQKDLPVHQQSSAVSFEDTDYFLARYDAGLFCHSPTGGGGPLETSFYGQSCIPKAYVEQHWTPWFELMEYRYADTKCLHQNAICGRKR